MKSTVFISMVLLCGVAAACSDDAGSSDDSSTMDDSNADDSSKPDDEPGKPSDDVDPAPTPDPDDGKDPVEPEPDVDDPKPEPEPTPEPKPEAMGRGAANPPKLGAQIDRVGRPAISTALISTFEADDTKKGTAKDKYNASAPKNWATFTPMMVGSLAILDALDGTCGNQLLAAAEGDRYAALAGILADDRLYVNSASGECGTYLGLEAEIVGALEPGQGGCGGRTPKDDVIDRSYSVLAAGILTGVDDTISSDGQPHSISKFPFLAAPAK